MAGAQGGGFGQIAMATAKLTLKAALNSITNNANIINYVSEQLYAHETGKTNWQTLPVENRAIWQQRVRTVVIALADTVSF